MNGCCLPAGPRNSTSPSIGRHSIGGKAGYAFWLPPRGISFSILREAASVHSMSSWMLLIAFLRAWRAQKVGSMPTESGRPRLADRGVFEVRDFSISRRRVGDAREEATNAAEWRREEK